MKKYKIRVRILPENVCCGMILNGWNFWGAYEAFAGQMTELGFSLMDIEIISIGEL